MNLNTWQASAESSVKLDSEVSRLGGRATTACPPYDEVAVVHAQGNALQAFSIRPTARERHGRLLIGAFELLEGAKLLLPVALVAVD